MNCSEFSLQIYEWNEQSNWEQRFLALKTSHLVTFSASLDCSLYDVTNLLNNIPESNFSARRSNLFRSRMMVMLSSSFELHMVLQSWNESS